MIKPTEKRKIFVYGSLRTGFFNYDKYLKGNVLNCEAAKIKGKLFHMPNKGYPAVLDGDDYIYGEVMTVDNYEEVMVAMDEMEGYHGENSADNEYTRTVMDVEIVETCTIEKCYVYKYGLNDEDEFNKHKIYISHGDWKNFMTKFKKDA